MEFSEKLQQLRKEKGMTQEQLANELFVSRTAVSKWESGKGYPNIESLKNISKLFLISIDDLLSGEELISLAASENRHNINHIFSLFYGISDVFTLAFLFLPLYARQDYDMIRVVNLFSNPDVSAVTWTIYLMIPIVMSALGLIQLITQRVQGDRWPGRLRIISILAQALAVLAFMETRQPYAGSLLFLLLVIKAALLVKGSTIK